MSNFFRLLAGSDETRCFQRDTNLAANHCLRPSYIHTGFLVWIDIYTQKCSCGTRLVLRTTKLSPSKFGKYSFLIRKVPPKLSALTPRPVALWTQDVYDVYNNPVKTLFWEKLLFKLHGWLQVPFPLLRGILGHLSYSRGHVARPRSAPRSREKVVYTALESSDHVLWRKMARAS